MTSLEVEPTTNWLPWEAELHTMEAHAEETTEVIKKIHWKIEVME